VDTEPEEEDEEEEEEEEAAGDGLNLDYTVSEAMDQRPGSPIEGNLGGEMRESPRRANPNRNTDWRIWGTGLAGFG